jgi:hypothetical protein
VSTDPVVELRGDVLREHVDVLDAVAQSIPGSNRMTIVREILADWVEREHRRATLVLRVTRGNGNAAESGRNRGGNGAEP